MLNLTDVFRNLNEKMSVILVAFDYSKAFDVIDHELLSANLHFFILIIRHNYFSIPTYGEGRKSYHLMNFRNRT